MTDFQHTFRNVILCDDVREETGNKKSLMGVFAGDLLVGEIPAVIQIAIYSEFLPADGTKETRLTITLFVDSEQIAKAQILAPANSGVGMIVLPKALVRFEKESIFRVVASDDDGSEIELISKKIMKSTPT